MTAEPEGKVTPNSVTIKPGARMRTAVVLAIVADAIQLILLPLFIEGAGSPTDDVLDVAMAAILTIMLGWHWEFLPSFIAKLAPGIDMFPCWTLAVASVYRKSKRIAAAAEGIPTGTSHAGPRAE
jgi:hypothetical protein